MDPRFREVFITTVIRFKRIDFQNGTAACLQPNELLIISRAANGCACTKKGYHVSEIHQDLHISKPAVSQALNSLEKRGYIIRTIDPDDRRKITVRVTGAGEAELENAREYYDRALKEVLNRFGAENTETLLVLLDRLMNILEEL